MNICGIICEYNPFHSGHEYHIESTRKKTGCDGIIGIMSGNFTQRGIPSIIDKWTRTEMAIKSGCDLILELPCVFAVSSAEFFAKGAISLINSLGIVNFLSFGSEHGDIEILKEIASVLNNEPDKFKDMLKFNLNKGLAFPKARSLALQDYFTLKGISYSGLSTLLDSPNNLLAIEYAKMLLKTNSNIHPITIRRFGSGYNDTSLGSSFPSASAIRQAIKADRNNFDFANKYIPKSSLNTWIDLKEHKYPFVFSDDMFNFIKYKILTQPHTLKNIPDASEGLDCKITNVISKCNSMDSLIASVKSKRYTYTRISRILCQYFIGFDSFNICSLRNEHPSYARVLGFNKTGASILRQIKNKGNIEIITKIPKIQNEMLSLDLQATHAYSMLNNSISAYEDFVRHPVIIK